MRSMTLFERSEAPLERSETPPNPVTNQLII